MRNIGIFGAFVALCVVVSVGTRCSAETTGEENMRKLAVANNKLAVTLFRELVARSSTKNVFFSPLSISAALGMLLLGARGETKKELRKVLGFKNSNLRNGFIHLIFSYYLSEVLKSGDSSGSYVLNSANSILVDESLEMLEKYRRRVQKLYRASARNVDFANNAPGIVEEINDWVKEETNGKIDELLDYLDPMTVLALLNAVYFKGTWEVMFQPNRTSDRIFYNYGLESKGKKVPTMILIDEFRMFISSKYEALELPFKGRNVSMLILNPYDAYGLSTIEENLTPEELTYVQRKLRSKTVAVILPKFSLEFEEELIGYLPDIGVTRIFSDRANFSRISNSSGVCVSTVLHKAVIEVDEQGSEVTAVPGDKREKRVPLIFQVERPFLFVILEKGSKSNMILFMGSVKNF